MMYVLLAIVVIVIFIIIGVHNRIIGNFNASQRAWADVATYERQKVTILDGLEPLISQYSNFESDTLKTITQLRNSISNLSQNNLDVDALQNIQAETKLLMDKVSIVVENYPDLKANEIYLKLMKEITDQNENVGAAISIFNRNVEIFNNSIEVFPNSMVNNMISKKVKIQPFTDSSVDKNIEYKPNF